MRRSIGIALASMALVLGASVAVAGTAAAAPAPNTTHVIPLNNAGATITDPHGHEVAAESAGDGCRPRNTCFYTGPDLTGQVFELYTCGTYYLHHWTQYGSIYNNNIGNVTAYTYYSPGNVDWAISQGSDLSQWYSLPDNEVVPC